MSSTLGKLFNKSVPVPFSGSSSRFVNPFAGKKNNAEAQLAAMGSVGTLFSIVDLLANTTSQVDWKLYRKSADQRRVYEGQETRIEVTKHAALDLWNAPNDFFTRQEFVETFQQHQELVGESWWLVGRDARLAGFDIPMSLWPIRPDKMNVVPSKEDYIKGYTYTSPDGDKIPLEVNEVIFIRRPNPMDPYRGMGPVQSLMADLDSTKYSAEWNRNFFLNSAEPGGIIQVDKRLSDDEFDEMTLRWNEQHRGVSRAHRVAVIEQGQWVDRSFSMRDMQFVQLREVSRDVIMEAFRIHKHMLGISDDVNRANADAADVVFSRRLTVPRLERIKQALNNDFLPMFGSTGVGLEFDYCNPVPEDQEAENAERTSKASAAATLVAAGFDPTEVLQTVGLPDMTFVGRDNGQAAPQDEPVPA